jgi:methylenetetrahydrofolate dehydrogenase (NADP+)/methenyltetrahydrofolate cyclohydrolase
MKISGTEVADNIKKDLRLRINILKEKGIKPKIAIITLGPSGAWEFYVRQKLKTAGELGIETAFIPMSESTEQAVLDQIEIINADPHIHGVIVQRPMPDYISKEKVINKISPEKDIDGFAPDSKYEVPVWLAAEKLILESLSKLGIEKKLQDITFVVIGKGETAGGPAIKGLKKLGVNPLTIDSKTKNPGQIIKKGDVVISCAGKKGIVNSKNIKKNAILIGVGTRGEEGKLKGDYEIEDIDQIAASFTPTPGGVGPVNLAYLFNNLVTAAEKA